MDRGVLKGGDRECEVGGVKRSEEVVSGGKRVQSHPAEPISSSQARVNHEEVVGMEGGEEVAIITAKRPQGPEESVRCKDLRGRCEGIKRCDGEEIAIKISLKGLKGQKSPSDVAGSAYFNQSEWKKGERE